MPDLPLSLHRPEGTGFTSAHNRARDAVQTATALASGTLCLLTPAQCAAEPPRSYVVKGILAPGNHGAIVGLPGTGKSVLAPFIGYRVALGLDVFGCRTRQSPVLYLAAEDGAGMKVRIRALYEQMGDAPDFHLQPVPIDLLAPDSPHVAEVEDLIALLQPGLVIIDTIARAFPGLGENDPDKMGHVVKVARGFTTVCDSAVLSLHHPTKEGAMSPRGHGVLDGDLDVTLYLAGKRAEPRTVTMGKNRNGPSDLTFSFNVAVHHMGIDADGDPITAPVAEVEAGPVRPKVHLTATQQNATAFLASLLCERAEPLPTGIGFPLGLKGTHEAAWRETCEARRLSTADTAKDRGRVFRKVYAELRDKGIIGTCDGWVWLTDALGGDRGITP